MVFELVKNSLRAVQERYMESDKVAPPVRLIVADGLEDVTIKAGSLLIYFKEFFETPIWRLQFTPMIVVDKRKSSNSGGGGELH